MAKRELVYEAYDLDTGETLLELAVRGEKISQSLAVRAHERLKNSSELANTGLRVYNTMTGERTVID